MPHRESFADIQAGKPIIYYAVRGHLMDDATQSGVHGISKMIDFEMPSIDRADSGMEPYTDGKQIKIKFEAMQTTYAAIKRAYYLAQALQTVIVQFGIDYYNFVDPYDLGCEVTLDISSTEITLTYEYGGKVTPAQWAAVRAAAAAAIAGTSNGTSISALTQGAYDDDEFGVAGIEGIYIGTGNIATDDELGLKEAAGTKIQIKIGKVGDTMRLQPISKKIEIKNTFSIFENRVSTLTRVEGYTNKEKVITVVLTSGTTIVFDNCTKMTDSFKVANGSGMVAFKNEGSTYTDPINATAINVEFDDTTSTITFHKQGAIL